MKLELIETHPLVEDVLEAWHERIGNDAPGYRGHVYRVLNFSLALVGQARGRELLPVVAAFHDLGIWSDETFDYLEPSAARALTYLREKRSSLDPREVEELIDLHHKLTRIHSNPSSPAEAFRRADLIDLSAGILSLGVPRAFIREVRQAFPNAGFHRCLLRIGSQWALENPERPVPVLKW